jgi:hypothetical protein
MSKLDKLIEELCPKSVTEYFEYVLKSPYVIEYNKLF